MCFNDKHIYEAAYEEYCLSVFPGAMINTMTKSNCRGKGLFQLTLPGHTPPEQELKARTEAEITEEYCLLVYSIFHTQPAFSYTPGPPAQGLTPPTGG